MRDPLPAIRAAWTATLRDPRAKDLGVDDPDALAGNVWQLIQGEVKVDDKLGIHFPALVWESQGVVIERTPDGRVRPIETMILEMRHPEGRELMEIYRGHLAANDWQYIADDYGIDLVVAVTEMRDPRRLVQRRLAAAEFIC